MAEERKSYIKRSLAGKERTDDGIKSHEPKGRFSLFWDVFKGRFGRFVLVNLLLVLFFAPLIAIIILRTMSVAGNILVGPYAGGLGVGAGALVDVSGYAESMLLSTDLVYFAMLIPALVIAGVGLAGGAYLVRNVLRTQGIFDFKDFGRGIKRGFLPSLEATLLFSAVLFVARSMGNYCDFMVAHGSALSGWLIASKVIGYLLVALVSLISLWMISLGTSYKLGPWALFKNAVVLTFTTFPFSVLFAALALWHIFIIIFVSGIFFTIVLILTVFFGFVYALLVWMDFTQWVYDKKVNPESVVAQDAEEKEEAPAARDTAPDPESYRRVIVSYGKSYLASRPIQPVDADATELTALPAQYTREDLKNNAEARKALAEETAAYEKEHLHDERYVEYNKMFEERDRALQGKGKGKKLTPPKRLKRKN